MSPYVDGFLNAQYDAGFTANVSNNAELAAGVSACIGADGTVRFSGLLDEIRIADTADPTILPPVTAPDALAILQRAVSLPVTPLCPSCPVEP